MRKILVIAAREYRGQRAHQGVRDLAGADAGADGRRRWRCPELMRGRVDVEDKRLVVADGSRQAAGRA